MTKGWCSFSRSCTCGAFLGVSGRAWFISSWRHHFRLSRDVERSRRATCIARSIAGPCRPSLTCLLFPHWESFSWSLPKPACLCKVSAFRRVGIQAIKNWQKNGKEQWKRNKELWKQQPKVLRLSSVDLERSDKNVRFQRQSPKKGAIGKTRSSSLCFGLHTRLEWLPKLTTGNQNLATKIPTKSGE